MAGGARARAGRKVFYLCYEYPVLTQTFTSGEVAGLRREGVDVRVVSLIRPRGDAAPDPSVVHLPPPASVGCLSALLVSLLLRPDRLLGLLGEIAAARYRDEPLRCWARGFLQLAWGAHLAERIRTMRPRPHLHAQFVDAASTVAYVAARLAGTTFSVTNHTAYNPYLLREKLRHAAVFLSISRFDREHLRRLAGGVRRAPVAVAYQGIDVEAWGEPRTGPFGSPARLLSVGALREKKGHHVLLRAVARLPDVRLTIVGDGAERTRLDGLVEELGLGGRVRLVGAEDPARVRERMAGADLFVLACVRAANGDLDGIPISLMEAMAAGVPVVSTRMSGIPELIADREEGLLAPPGDAAALAERIRALLDDPPRARAMALRAREKVRRQHDAGESARRVAALLDQARCSRYQETVRRMPSSNPTRGS